MKNRGGVGYAPHLVLSAWLPQRVLSVAEISESMANAVASAKQSPPYNGQQMEADQEVWVPVNGLPVDPTAWKDIREGKTHLYAFIVLGFRDDTLREGDYWLSEFCGHVVGNVDQEMHICGQKTYLLSSAH